MSARISLSQKSRPYKIEVYGLQDNYIGTLQSYNDSFIGQIIEPEIVISDDGTQTFVCSIPKFYIDPETNLKLENPRWADVNNGVLAENTRILKVFLKNGEEDKIYPFIVDKITDKRDSHFAVYKEVECNGFAYAELGKTGYKLELTKEIVELELKKNPDLLPTMDYWLDKVFPNEKDANGRIIKWLTPWCYEIRMDWSHYSTGIDRESNKMYEDSYVNSWMVEITKDENENVTSEKLVSNGFTQGKEKARFIDCTKGNRYNITQSIAEAFEVFCQYEYKCDIRGHFVKEYFEEIKDENDVVLYNKVWTGRKVVFYNRAIKTENPVFIEYKKNLDTISRTKESSELYTKLYVTPIESSTMDSGYISIADTTLNPTLDDFILNFDYLYSTGAITQYQMNFIKTYEVETYKLNKKLMDLAPFIEELTVQINDLESKKKVIENEISSAQTTLQDYETLRNSEVRNTPIEKNENNAYSMIFYEDGDIKKGRFSIEGVDINSIKAYSDNNYNSEIFNGLQLVVSEDWVTPGANDENYYLLVNEFGWPKYIYTSKDNTKLPSIVYFKLTYCPKNEYDDICAQLKKRIEVKQDSIYDIEEILIQEEIYINEKEPIKGLKGLLAYREQQQNSLLKDKDILNYKLETVLGPALREGYWTPDSYEDPGESRIIENIPRNDSNSGVVLKFDNEPFEGEELNYYYASIDDQIQNNKTYYPYLSIDEKILKKWADCDLSTLTLRLSNYSGEGNSQLDERLIYNNAGFILGFINGNTPILLLNNKNIPYDKYGTIEYIISNNKIRFSGSLGSIVSGSSENIWCYPRIFIYDNNVNYKSDELYIIPYKDTFSEELQALTKYEDYTILTRDGRPCFTLKPTNVNNLNVILNYNYRIEYRVSRANEMLYLDAKNVARDNSQPKYSYELKVSNIPGEIDSYELGQLVYINDYSIGIHAASGYVSEIKLKLNSPKDDELKIKNYKTKFEDLFSTITASSEAMRNNQHSYNIAAGSFNADGTISGSVLQNSILNNNISMNYSNTNVEIDDVNGIVLTNSQPYLNGVYGQVKLIGGGIFLSNAIDAAGARIWNTGITPNGINAALISAGQLDVEKVRVFAGDNVAFQWNGEGIFAYKRDENGSPDLNTYVHYSDKGLQFISAGHTSVDLGWNGLLISAQDGSTELSGNLGLTIYDGVPNKDDKGIPLNPIIRIGKFEESERVDYGLKFYKKEGKNKYVPTLVTTNDGELWLKDVLSVGDPAPIVWTDEDGTEHIINCIAGISGIKETYLNEEDGQIYIATDSVRFWAGRDVTMMNVAPFRVLQDGTLWATQANITGDIKATNITANKGTIGGWQVNENSLSSVDGKTNLYSSGNEQRININNNFIVDANGTMTANGAKISGSIIAEGCQIGGLTVNQVTDAVGAVGDITANMNNITVEITSSNGNITKYGEEFSTILKATIKRGGIEMNDIEHQNYIYNWKYSDNGEQWEAIVDDIAHERTVTYIEPHTSQRYIKCFVSEKEDNNDNLA